MIVQINKEIKRGDTLRYKGNSNELHMVIQVTEKEFVIACIKGSVNVGQRWTNPMESGKFQEELQRLLDSGTFELMEVIENER